MPTYNTAPIRAVLFDLDGVIVSTDLYHYHAWKLIADTEGIPFDRIINDQLRGISRMESLEILLKAAPREYSPELKSKMAERKNELYRSLLDELSPRDILPGVRETLADLKARKIRVAIGSSSRNTKQILKKLELSTVFDVVIDGTQISHSKPDPEVFLRAAEQLGADPLACLVVEDAPSGILAAKRAQMRVVGVGPAAISAAPDWRLADLTQWRVVKNAVLWVT